MDKAKIKELVAQMTLEEKASMCSGADFWHTDAVERLGIPASMVSDGPHGLRKQGVEEDHLGIHESIPAVCFPAGCGTAASFNRELLHQMGETLGNECQAEGVSVILGPAVNIKRSPLCGRNFEYYSEDPLVATEISGALIGGIQSKNVGTSIKHFLANNQEHRRMSSSSVVDERTLREIYMAAFEGAICKQKPWTVMCSYNRINDVYAPESKFFLTDVLRNEWGFDGYVMSDWGAVNDRVPDLAAGLDLEMPSSGDSNTKDIVAAVKNGELAEELVDQACERILSIVYRFEENRDKEAVFDRAADHKKAAKVAEETMVLLKNNGVLPLMEGQRIALIGEFAKKPRFQGGGSSHINCSEVTSAWDVLKDMPGITYAQGYVTDEDVIQPDLATEALEVAEYANVAVIFAGLPDSFESEGYDRTHMRLPECQNALIDAICAVQPNVVVVLHNGSPVEMPWADKVQGIIESYLGGQAVGEAQAKILFGEVNPSAKLAETFPKKLEDNPSYLYFRGEGDRTEYREGVFVGYRYYEKKKMDVLFPFGHGLSYTTFAYSNLCLDKKQMKDTEELTVSVDITNTGTMAGKEVVQIYVKAPETDVIRPVKELREFAKVSLEPGEAKTVTFTLGKRAFAYWDVLSHSWWVDSGDYTICAAASSADVRVEEVVTVIGTGIRKRVYTPDTTFYDIYDDPKALAVVQDIVDGMIGVFTPMGTDTGAISDVMGKALVGYMPLRGAMTFLQMSGEEIRRRVELMNQ